ncbi:MAG: sensor histidine kinase [Acidimicrobiales bacterium]
MRRRLTVSILLLLAATLVVTTLTSYLLIRRATVASAEQQLAQQTRTIGLALAGRIISSRAALVRQLQVIERAGAFGGVAVVALEPDGSVSGRLPPGVQLRPRAIRALGEGRQVTGHTASLLVFSVLPITPSRSFRSTPLLVIARHVRHPITGVGDFLLVGTVALFVSALVAAALARRFALPIREAVDTTRRMAAGDLDATVPVRPREDPELAQLATSINAMGANLLRARDQERQFLLSISHELRTPLTSIRGYADAVVEGATDDLTGAVSIIGAEARRLERLVQDLLDLARLDADRFSLSVGPVDAREVARQAADGFRPAAAALGLTLVTDLGPDVPLWVEADPDRLAQIMANLLENASAFARNRIVLAEGAASGHPTLSVSDDGPGIPADELPHIFERHVTSDRVPRRSTGSGLGLAIVLELATAMGADVRAGSPIEGGRGARVTVTLRPGTPPADYDSGPDGDRSAGDRPTLPTGDGPGATGRAATP